MNENHILTLLTSTAFITGVILFLIYNIVRCNRETKKIRERAEVRFRKSLEERRAQLVASQLLQRRLLEEQSRIQAVLKEAKDLEHRRAIEEAHNLAVAKGHARTSVFK